MCAHTLRTYTCVHLYTTNLSACPQLIHTHTVSLTIQETAWPMIDGGTEITIHNSKHRAMHRSRGGQRAIRQRAGGGWVQRGTEGIKVVKPRDTRVSIISRTCP